jgi:hypothetical protein
MRGGAVAGLMIVAILVGAGAGYLVGNAGERTVTSVSTTTVTNIVTVDHVFASDHVEVLSVTGPIAPYNWGGPVVGIALKNVGNSSIVALNAALSAPLSGPYVFTFGVNKANVLQPGQSVRANETLLGGSIQSGMIYPLTVNGTLAGGPSFSSTIQVEVVSPS